MDQLFRLSHVAAWLLAGLNVGLGLGFEVFGPANVESQSSHSWYIMNCVYIECYQVLD